MRNKLLILGIALVVIGAILIIIGTTASAGTHVHHQRKGCIAAETSVPGWNNMPYRYTLIFCGNSIQDQLLDCPAGVTETPMYPAEVFYCTSTHYPHGFPASLYPPVPKGY